jgi:hypothetical protein
LKRANPIVKTLVPEASWDLGRLLTGRGLFYPGDIELEVVADVLKQVDEAIFIEIDGTTFDLRLIRPWVDAERKTGQKIILNPHPVPDTEREGFVWSSYSPERFLERARSVYEVAVMAYKEVVVGEFGRLAAEFRIAPIFPAVLHGRLFAPAGSNEPWLTTWFEPEEEPSGRIIDFRLTASQIRVRDGFDAEWAKVKRLRPRIKSWGYVSGRSDVFEARPSAAVTLDWLRSDLNFTGWLDGLA